MKKLLALLSIGLLCSLTFEVTAQWTPSGNNIHFNSGNVGIGTTSPLNKLHINGHLRISETLKVYHNFSGGRGLELQTNSGSTNAPAIRWQDDSGIYYAGIRGQSDGSIQFGTGWLSEVMRMTPEGLSVSGILKSTGAYTLESANPTLILKEEGIADNDFDIQVNNGDFKILKVDDARSVFEDVFTILDNSTVGIGTSLPNGRLEIKGNSGVYSDFAGYEGITSSNFLPNGKEPTLVISENLAGTLIPATGGQVTYRGGISFGRGGPGIYSINPNPAGSAYYGEIRFHTTYWDGSNYSNADRMVIKLNGNIGIGTTTPTNKLEVNGKIRSKEVIVEATGWPDYVFEADYDLPTLAEIEAFIKANKHLPEVPSAKQVEENGLTLGEMNALLLKKIEELTLHTIAIKKEVDTLKKENEILKEKINLSQN